MTQAPRKMESLNRALDAVADWMLRRWHHSAWRVISVPPTFWAVMVPMLLLSGLLYTRSITSNYIFDEQEALLANPYVHGKKLSFKDAIHRDFWGLPPDRSVGSYRPLPNYVWRGVWQGQKALTAGLNAALRWAGPTMRQARQVPATGQVNRWWHIAGLSLALQAAALAAWYMWRRSRQGGGQRGWKVALIVAVLVAYAALGWWLPARAVLAGGGALGLMVVGMFSSSLFMPIAIASVLWWLSAAIPAGPQPAVMQPWLYHWVNVLIHAANGALLTTWVYRVSRHRGQAWLAGTIFVSAAVITEAVSGVVGLADVLGGMGALLALHALRLPLWAMPVGVFASIVLGLFSKESALVCVGLVPLATVIFAPSTHPRRPWRWLRGLLALGASVGALVVYVELRKRWFPAPPPSDLHLPSSANLAQRAMHGFRVWFHQAPLPRDPLNNPLVNADFPHRVAGAMRVLWRGLVQVVFPQELSGDYSFRQEPVPGSLTGLGSMLGVAASVLLPAAGFVAWARAWWKERAGKRAMSQQAGVRTRDLPPGWLISNLPSRQMLFALGAIWVIAAYFPHSNIPVLLPTVRADRFWYFPIIGSSLALSTVFAWLYAKSRRWHRGVIAVGLISFFFTFQAIRARIHAFDYTDDLIFWDATRRAVPQSAKAHLNYSVMWGARGRLDIRLVSSKKALELAPKWPMAHIYLGDTLCRLHRAEEAWPHYRKGFELAPGDSNLIALSLQCMWDEHDLHLHARELRKMADKHPGSWLAYLINDTLDHGADHSGVDPKYRPRGYNEGPKE